MAVVDIHHAFFRALRLGLGFWALGLGCENPSLIGLDPCLFASFLVQTLDLGDSNPAAEALHSMLKVAHLHLELGS